MLNSNITLNSAPLQDTRLRNLSDLDFDLSRSLKVKCDGIILLVIYGLLLFTLMLWPNWVPLPDKALKSEWPWHFQVTHGQIWWCHWTPYIYLLHIYSGTWELGTPKGLWKTVLNSEVVLFLRFISVYWISLGTGVAVLNSQVVPISSVTKMCFAQLRCIGQVRRCLNQDATRSLVGG